MSRTESFETRWNETPKSGTSERLPDLLQSFYAAYSAENLDLERIKTALVTLLEFLVSDAGMMEANYQAVDGFICLLTAELDQLHGRLPGDYQLLLDDIGIDLHEAFKDPELAGRFGSAPENILARAKELPTDFSGGLH